MGILKQLTKIFEGEDEDSRLLREASEGAAIDYEELGKAYWRKYHGTYREPEIWMVMSTAQKEGVYRERRQLKQTMMRLSREAREWVDEMEPNRPEDWRPRRRIHDLE